MTDQGREPKTKPCKVCGEAIQPSATKCTHCDSYQNWYSNVGISTAVLSLLVALISVVSTSAPVIKDLITPKDSELTVSIQGMNAQNISIMVSNLGVRAGSIRGGKISLGSYYSYDPDYLIPLSLIGLATPARIVEAGKSELLTFEGARTVDEKTKKHFEVRINSSRRLSSRVRRRQNTGLSYCFFADHFSWKV